MGSKKKLLTSVAALTLAAATLLGGTFAWQSISQTALNESTDSINPGGRLHNDIASAGTTETTNYIYVENFTDEGGEDIYARIRLEEYMELVMNYGVEDVEVVKNVAGVKTPKNGSSYTANNATRQNEFDYTYELHLFDENAVNATDDYWTWILGTAEHNANHGAYMPTFNKNKDSLAADQNGRYKYAIGGITERTDNYDMTDETGFVSYVDNEEAATAGYGTYKKTAYAIYDNDGDQTDELAGLSDAELKDIIANGTDSTKLPENYTNAIHLEEETHTAKRIGNTNGTISMKEWLELIGEGTYDADTHGRYWVYDTDGWVYWSSPIKSGTTTGPLLEGFSLNHEMNDTWYYAINVEAQFITADDLGAADNTGFYDQSGWYDPAGLGEEKAADFEGMGQAPTEDALTLLKWIGVDTGEAAGDDSSAGGDQGSETTGTVSFNVVKAGNDSDGFVKNETAANGYQLGQAGTGATVAFNGNATEFTVSASVTGSKKTPVLSLDEEHDTYTITPPSGEESQYRITVEGDEVGTFDAATGVLTLSGDEDLDGLTVIATIGGVEYELTLYITRSGKTIWAVFSNSDTVEGAYDLTFFTGTYDPSDRTIAAMAGVDKADVVYSTANYTDSSYSTTTAYDDTQGSRTKIQKVLNVRFANEVKPTDLEGTFHSVGRDYAETDYRVTFDFTNLDTSETTYMRSTFCIANVDTLNLSTWNTSSVKDMHSMFSSCRMTSLTLGEGWDTSKVQIMGSMFSFCENLTLDCSDWDVSSAKESECSGFNSCAPNVTEPAWSWSES